MKKALLLVATVALTGSAVAQQVRTASSFAKKSAVTAFDQRPLMAVQPVSNAHLEVSLRHAPASVSSRLLDNALSVTPLNQRVATYQQPQAHRQDGMQLANLSLTAAGDGSVNGLDTLYYAVGSMYLDGTNVETLSWEMRVSAGQGDTVYLENLMPLRNFQSDRVTRVAALYKSNKLRVINRQYVLSATDAEDNKYDFFFANYSSTDDKYVDLTVSADGSRIATSYENGEDVLCYWEQPQAADGSHEFTDGKLECWDILYGADYANYDLDLRVSYGRGVNLSSNNTEYWEMISQNGQGDTVYFTNVIPMTNYDVQIYGIRQGNKITIPSTYRLYRYDATHFITLVDLSASTETEVVVSDVVLTVEEDGSYSIPAGSMIAYWVSPFENGQLNLTSEDAGVYQGYYNVAYSTTEWPQNEPTAYAESDGVTLYGSFSDAYGLANTFGMVAPYQTLTYTATTPASYGATATWKAYTMDDDWAIADSLEATGATFGYYADPLYLHSSPFLTVSNEAGTDSKNVNATDYYLEDEYIYVIPGGSATNYAYYQGTYYHFSTAQYDRGLSLANFVGANSVISYQGKPKSPLYFESVALSALNFTAKSDDVKLTLLIRRCSRDAEGNIVPGDTIAASDATIADWVSSFTSGSYTYGFINFKNFYVFDEFGFTYPYDKDYLQISDEFMFEILGLDNSNLTVYFLQEKDYDVNGSKFTAYSLAKNPDYVRYESDANARIFFYLDDFAYGYLHTEQPTSVHFGSEGGSYAWNIQPMFRDADTNGNPTTALWYKEGTEFPEWITDSITSETYTTEKYEFTYEIQVAALPEGVSGRSALIQLEQWGAALSLEVLQGDAVSGIEGVATETRAYKATVQGNNIVVACPADVKNATLYDATGARVATVPVVGGKAVIPGARQGLNIVNFGGKTSVKVMK